MAEVIPLERRAQAMEECTTSELHIPAGGSPEPVLSAKQSAALVGDGLGLLVLRGLLIRRVGIDGRYGAELLGETDILRPFQDALDSPTLSLTTEWTVVDPTRLAVLDRSFLDYLTRYPEIARCLMARAVHRSRNLAVNMAIVHQARVDVRLHMLLWHLAARWGRVRSDGTILPLRLTHSVLADLVAARRPTVTSALSDLSRRGLMKSSGDRWMLFGEPPSELLELETRAPAAS
jgi:hypothetical protein